MNDQLKAKTAYASGEEEITIDLKEIWYLFLAKLKWVLLAAVIGALLLGLFSAYVQGPSYQSTAKMYIVSASNDSLVNLSELQISTNLTSDYKELVLSRPLLEKVIKNLKLDCTTNTLKSMLTVTNPSGTRILELTATANDPVLSKQIANELMYVSIPWLSDVMSSNEPNVIEEALEGKEITSVAKMAVIGAFAAAVICFAIFVLAHLMNDTVRSAEEFERYFGIVPLASVPDDDSMADDSDGSRKSPLRKLSGRKYRAKGVTRK